MILKFLKIREEHLEKIRLWRTSEEVTQYMYTNPVVTPENQMKWYQQILREPLRMDWVLDIDERKMGVVSLFDIEPQNCRCFWAYYIGEYAGRGQGIGKAIELNILNYVFERLDLHKLCCEVFEWNNHVVQIHQKYGTKTEGIFRDHILKRGEYHNVVRMGILRREWELNIKDKFEYPIANIEEWDDKKRCISALKDNVREE